MTGQEVQARERPDATVLRYAAEFAQVLPSHMSGATFARLAVGCLRRNPDLMTAAARNPDSLLHALMEAARLGLEPGTDEFYLTPRGGKQPGVLGIVGYRGEIELVYRAGAVTSVKAEVVYERDRFRFHPGMPWPDHEPDWFSDRGAVRGAYAYAHMAGGGTSRVVMIGPTEIARSMAASPTANASSSPWKTDYPAMVLKTAVHQLAKWVPTSAEYRREQLRSAATVAAETQPHQGWVDPPQAAPTPPTVTADEDGVITDEDEGARP